MTAVERHDGFSARAVRKKSLEINGNVITTSQKH